MDYASQLVSVGYALAYLIIFIIIFSESGLLIGFFLPGDSFLFTIGILTSQGHFNLYVLLILGVTAAITGDSVGYAFGRRVGPALFKREDSRFFRRSHLEKAHEFYEKHGVKTIVLARFVPLARTFAPILAGVGNMRYSTFISYNIIGGTFWVCSVILSGYILGSRIPNIETYILPIIFGVIIVSILPGMIPVLKGIIKRRRS